MVKFGRFLALLLLRENFPVYKIKELYFLNWLDQDLIKLISRLVKLFNFLSYIFKKTGEIARFWLFFFKKLGRFSTPFYSKNFLKGGGQFKEKMVRLVEWGALTF